MGKRSTTHGAQRQSFPTRLYALRDQLTGADIQILRALLRYPFVRAEDLAIATGMSIATVYRHLSVLHQHGAIESLSAAVLGTASCEVFHLSNLGLHLLALHEQTEPASLASRWNADERGLLRTLPRLARLMLLHTCINGLVVSAPEALGQQGRRATVRWHCLRDFRYRFSYRERPASCAADALLVLRLHPGTEGMAPGDEAEHGSEQDQYRWYSVLLLLDTGVGGQGWIQHRLQHLLSYRECAERWPLYQHFPLVLIVVTEPQRTEKWLRAARETALQVRCAPLAGAIAVVPQAERPPHTPEHSTPFNTWRLPWTELATSAPCRIELFLAPLPSRAIPPSLLDHDMATDEGIQAVTEEGVSSGVAPSHARVIRGGFAERAQRIIVEQGQETNEQEVLALLGLVLDRRHLMILLYVLRYPLLATEELAAFFQVHSRSLARYLRDIHRYGCVDEIDTHMGPRWQLTERGLRFLAIAHSCHIKSIAVPRVPAVSADSSEEDEQGIIVQRGLEGILKHIEHTVGIYGFFVSLVRAMQQGQPDANEGRVLWWNTGMACERRYRDHDAWQVLRPDAEAEYQDGEHRLRFWLEWDRGTMNTRDLAKKFTAYARYVASRAWREDHAILPVLLMVVPEPGQEMRVARVATVVLAETPGLIVRTTTATLLDAHGPLAPVWLQIHSHIQQPSLQAGQSVPHSAVRRPFFGY